MVSGILRKPATWCACPVASPTAISTSQTGRYAPSFGFLPQVSWKRCSRSSTICRTFRRSSGLQPSMRSTSCRRAPTPEIHPPEAFFDRKLLLLDIGWLSGHRVRRWQNNCRGFASRAGAENINALTFHPDHPLGTDQESREAAQFNACPQSNLKNISARCRDDWRMVLFWRAQ